MKKARQPLKNGENSIISFNVVVLWYIHQEYQLFVECPRHHGG